jgi:hypothetical protein
VHDVAVPPSSAHVNVEPVLLEVKLNVALVWFVGFAGFDVIVTVGGMLSIVVKLQLTGAASAVPSEAFTVAAIVAVYVVDAVSAAVGVSVAVFEVES